MKNIKLDVFNPEPYVNHIPEIKIAANKKNLELLIITVAAVAIAAIVYYLINQQLEERDLSKR